MTATVARRKKRAGADSDRAPLGHGEDALAPATLAPAAWSPGANDHLVYTLVKFGGKTQELTARLLGISQPTVSRIVDRYERWQAHAKEREGGRLDHAERLRAQRWLTYERNELILASALRIAGEMEGLTELTKSVVSRPVSQFTKETEIRSESATIDRHGIASRFLRLAFRINMEQLKLVSQEAPPLPEPLTAEELAEQEAASAAILAEFEAVERATAEAAEANRRRVAEEQRVAEEMAEQERAERARLEELAGKAAAQEYFPDEHESADPPVATELIHAVNKMNEPPVAESDASDVRNCTCAADVRPENFSQPPGRPPARSGLKPPTTIHGDPPFVASEAFSAAGPQRTAGPTFAPAVP